MRTPVVLISMFAVVLLAGAAVGAVQAEDDATRIDLSDVLEDRMFYENGSVNTTAAERQPDRFPDAAAPIDVPDLVEAPGADRWLRQHMIAPLLRGAIWVASVGEGIGYAMASTIGVGPTRFAINGGMLTVLVGVGWHAYRLVREVAA